MYITHNVSEASLKSGAWLLPVARILWLCRASSRTYHWWHTDYNNFMSFYFSWDIQSWVSELLSSISCIALLHFYWETMRSHDCSRLLILSEYKVWWWNVVELELCLDSVLMKVLEDKSRKVQWTILDIEGLHYDNDVLSLVSYIMSSAGIDYLVMFMFSLSTLLTVVDHW